MDLKSEQHAAIKDHKEDQNTTEKPLGMFEFRSKIVWFNAIGFLVMHLLGLYGFWLMLCMPIKQFIVSFAWVYIMGNFGGIIGIVIGAHRLFTHRTFKAKIPLQILLITAQTIAGQNCCYIWCRDHRLHHKYSDTDADPHNASRGFFFSHIGWLMMKKHPEVIRKGKTIDMSDLEANPIVMFQRKYYVPMYLCLAIIFPVMIPVYLWKEDLWMSILFNYFVRYIFNLNCTWAVNSWAHIHGTRPYDKNISPAETDFVSILTYGEGWHNYHHTFPWDYKASEYGKHLNGATKIINFFAKIGWAYDLREASPSLVTTKIKKYGDGSHAVFSREASEGKEMTLLEDYKVRHMGKDYETEEDGNAEGLALDKGCSKDPNLRTVKMDVIRQGIRVR